MSRILTLCCLLIAIAAAEVPQDVVGGLDLNHVRVVISDGPTFPTDQVVAALRDDPLLVSAAHFFAPRQEFLRLIAERCATGYRSHGFPEPTVSAVVRGRGAAGHVVVSVTEGARLRWGKVVIPDPGPLGEEAVRQRLCAPWRSPDADADDDPEDPLIVAGEPARFDDIWNRNLVRTIADFYALEGFQDCSPVVRTGEPRDGAVDCLISFKAPPRALVVNRVIVAGAQRNQPEAVIAWLARNTDLRVGGPATRGVMNTVRKALADSGRLLSSSVTTAPVADDPQRIDVTVTLVESDRLPLLDQPLNDLQQDGLRWRERILREVTDGSVSFRIGMKLDEAPVRFDLLINARHGLLVRLTSLDPAIPFDATAGVEGQRLFYLSHVHDRAASIAWEVYPVLTLKLETTSDPAHPHSFGFNMAYGSDPEEDLTEIILTPSFALSQISKAERAGDRLVSVHGTTTATIELTGDRPFLLTTQDGGPGDGVQLTRTPWAELVPMVTGKTSAQLLAPSADDGKALIGLLSDDLVPEVARRSGVDEAVVGVWLSAGIAFASTWLSDTAGAEAEKSEQRFRIPVDLPPEQMLAQIVASVRRMILEHTRDVWSASSWPVLIINEANAVMNGNTTHTRAMLTHLVDGRTMGPLGHGLLSYLMQFVDPRVARVIARLGHDKLTAEAWADDVATLVPKLPPVRTALSSFSDPTVAALALPEDRRAAFTDLVRRAKAEATPAEEQALIRDTARLLWSAGGEAMVRGWLDDLEREPAASGGSPP